MGQSVTPISYRLGFYRVWDSLYTNKIYYKNYDLFFKSQMISAYVEGFFKRWTWDGKRSFFLNFLFSHVELSWSSGFLHMYVYVYNTGLEYMIYKFKKNLFKNVNFLNQKSSLVKDINNFFYTSRILGLRKNIFKRKNNNFLNYFYNFYLLLNYCFLSSSDFFHMYGSHRNFDLFFNNAKVKSVKDYYLLKIKMFFEKIFLLNKKNYLGFDLVDSVEGFSKNKKISTVYFLKSDQKIKNIFLFFVFFTFLAKSKYYKTFFLFLNYFFLTKPLEYTLKRHFIKDFYNFLQFKKIKDYQNYVQISIKRLMPSSLTASAIGKHMWLKLAKKYKFGSVVHGILRTVKNIDLFKGFLVRANGRFTKKQRAWHSVFRYGKVPLSEQKAKIDDYIVNVRLRYGMCSVRIYINYN